MVLDRQLTFNQPNNHNQRYNTVIPLGSSGSCLPREIDEAMIDHNSET